MKFLIITSKSTEIKAIGIESLLSVSHSAQTTTVEYMHAEITFCVRTLD
jgi:hypothetical protein